MQQEKVTVSARITKEMHIFCLQKYTNITDAINAGLELLRDQEYIQNVNVCIQNEENNKRDEDAELKILQDGIICNLKERIVELKEEIKETKLEQKEQINLFVKQMEIKDTQIKELNTTLQSQVLNIHMLAQDNVNIKLITESKSKKWYEFWK